jgi:hypothetical protein
MSSKTLFLISLFASISLAHLSWAQSESDGSYSLGTGTSKAGSNPLSHCVDGVTTQVSRAEAGLNSPSSLTDLSLRIALFGNPAFDSGSLGRENESTPEGKFSTATKDAPETILNVTDLPAQYHFFDELIEYSHVTDDAQSSLSNQKAWQDRCGDQVISQRGIGADIFINMKIEMPKTSEDIRNNCFSNISAHKLRSWVALSSISNSDLKAVQSECPNSKISLKVLQRGGNPNALPTSLKLQISKNERGYADITCDIANPTDCITASHQLVEYVYGSLGFIHQVDQKIAPGSLGGPTVTNYVLSPYSAFGLYPGTVPDSGSHQSGQPATNVAN